MLKTKSLTLPLVTALLLGCSALSQAEVIRYEDWESQTIGAFDRFIETPAGNEGAATNVASFGFAGSSLADSSISYSTGFTQATGGNPGQFGSLSASLSGASSTPDFWFAGFGQNFTADLSSAGKAANVVLSVDVKGDSAAAIGSTFSLQIQTTNGAGTVLSGYRFEPTVTDSYSNVGGQLSLSTGDGFQAARWFNSTLGAEEALPALDLNAGVYDVVISTGNGFANTLTQDVQLSFDNLKLQVIPEPSTALLTMLGLLGSVFNRRLFRKRCA